MFASSLLTFQQEYDPLALAMRIAAFITWKRSGGHGRLATGDKPSGYDPTGTTIIHAPYVSHGIHHFHMDLNGTEPLLAYRLDAKLCEITLICLTTHRAMFHQNERSWMKRYGGTWRKRSLAPV